METILVKLFKRAKVLYKTDALETTDLPQVLIDLFKGQEIAVESYLDFDDIDIFKLLKNWKKSQDAVLSKLAAAFLDRKKFQKLIQINKSQLAQLKEELNQLLADSNLETIEEGYFWLENQVEDSFYNELYKEEEGKIRMLAKDGSLKDFGASSEIISRSHKQPDAKKQIYVSFELLTEEINDARLVEEIKNKLSSWLPENQ
jgi:hypothetical protein